MYTYCDFFQLETNNKYYRTLSKLQYLIVQCLTYSIRSAYVFINKTKKTQYYYVKHNVNIREHMMYLFPIRDNSFKIFIFIFVF